MSTNTPFLSDIGAGADGRAKHCFPLAVSPASAPPPSPPPTQCLGSPPPTNKGKIATASDIRHRRTDCLHQTIAHRRTQQFKFTPKFSRVRLWQNPVCHQEVDEGAMRSSTSHRAPSKLVLIITHTLSWLPRGTWLATNGNRMQGSASLCLMQGLLYILVIPVSENLPGPGLLSRVNVEPWKAEHVSTPSPCQSSQSWRQAASAPRDTVLQEPLPERCTQDGKVLMQEDKRDSSEESLDGTPATSGVLCSLTPVGGPASSLLTWFMPSHNYFLIVH